jgi:hypothetical protein
VACIVRIANRAVKGLVLPYIEFRLKPVNCAQTRLGIKVHREYPIAIESEILG